MSVAILLQHERKQLIMGYTKKQIVELLQSGTMRRALNSALEDAVDAAWQNISIELDGDDILETIETTLTENMDDDVEGDFTSKLVHSTSSLTEYEFYSQTPDNSEEFMDYVKFALANRADILELFKRISRLSVIVNGQ